VSAPPAADPLTLALASADAQVSRVQTELDAIAADLREKKRELADARRLREDAVLAILGKAAPRLFPEPAAEAPAAGPVVCARVGDLPLTEVRNMPSSVVETLATGGVRTLADLERAVGDRDGPDDLRAGFREVVATLDRQQEPPHGAFTGPLADLIDHAWDALADHLHASGYTRPDPPAKELPADPLRIAAADDAPKPVTPDSLGLTAAQLNGGQGYEAATRKAGKAPVKVQVLSGRSGARYVVVMATDPTATTRTWHVVRAYPEGEFTRSYPSARPRVRPDLDGRPQDRHCEVQVVDRSTGGRFVLGYFHDFRLVQEAVEPPAAKPARKRKAG
jgi:hypothetical protein